MKEISMKKILCALLVIATSAVFAVEKDCSDFNSDQAYSKVTQKVQSKGIKSLDISYSADLSKQVSDLQAKLQAAGIKVNATQVAGNAKCEMSNFQK